MSAATLETLRADVEAAVAACDAVDSADLIEWFECLSDAARKSRAAEALYLIARDQGLDAAMLHKLSGH